MIEWIIYLSIGVLAGTSAGLFGLGGGIIVVPALVMVYQWQGMNNDFIMHFAVGTSLMTIVVTSLSSAYSHYRYHHINWYLVRILAPTLLLGALAGSYFAINIASSLLQQSFAVFMFIIAVRDWLPSFSIRATSLITTKPLLGFGLLAGSISALLGIGGGTLIVPYLVTAKQSIKQAIGTSAACGFPITLAAVVGFICLGSEISVSDNVWQTGFVDWKACLGIVSTSIIFARLGASIAKRLPVDTLQRIFSIVLLLVAVKMWFETTV
ncbi:MAG: sulfite exporter TauE/SafE family protein [Gammaproteobacteria bacterium]|nr:sulfite exporter TauE/SafE family protein [Gammaproteobacteria bacterium]